MIKEEKINRDRSNMKYVLYSLFAALEVKEQERVFKFEENLITYTPGSGLLVEGRNPSILVNRNGVNLPPEYTSVLEIPYDWISSLKEKL